MFVSRNIYRKHVLYCPGDDLSVFLDAVSLAKSNINPDADKRNSPVCWCSTLLKITEDEKSKVVDRSLMNSTRARRKFIMLDVDYEADQWEDYEALMERVRLFAVEHETPLIIYPTLSFPAKPRCRIVFFTKRQMSEVGYAKAVTWLCGELMYDLTDKGDLRIGANRNLPIFSNDDQAENVVVLTGSRHDKPLDNSLWSDVYVENFVKRATSVRGKGVNKSKGPKYTFDNEVLYETMNAWVERNRDRLQTYEDTWMVLRAIAVSARFGHIQGDSIISALCMSLANAADDYSKIDAWHMDNIKRVGAYIANMSDEEVAIARDIFDLDPSLFRLALSTDFGEGTNG